MLKDYFVLAFKNVRKRGIRSWLTMLGIFIGIAAVVSLISLGAGLKTAVTGQFSTLSTDILTVSNAETGFGPPGSTAVKKLNEHDLDLIKEVNGVKNAIPRLIRVVKVEYNNEVDFGYIGSIPEEQEDADVVFSTFNVKTSEGKLLKADDYGKIMLGADYTDKNKFGKDIRIGSKLKIQGEEFEVIGFAAKASTFTINSVVFMTQKDMKRILDIEDEIDLIAVRVEDQKKINEVSDNLERKLRKDRNLKEGEEDFSVQTPAQSLDAVNTVLNIINIVVAGIAFISLFIGGIGIANTMFTSVLERTREIGVMKAIGAKNSNILSIFLIESGLLGLAGGIVGAIIGLGFAFTAASGANAAFGGTILNVSISWPLLFGAIGFSLFIGIISGIIPAYQASRLHPVEALRR